MTTTRVDGQWLYGSVPGALGAYWWCPVAFIDRATGKAYALYPGMSNEQATALVREAK